MNGKRFNFNLVFGEDEHKGTIFYNGKTLKTIDVVYLLNELSKENTQLNRDLDRQEEIISEKKIQLDYLKDENQHMKDVLELNELLKKSIKRQQLSNEECSKYIEEVVKENEQLKSTNMEMEDYIGRLEKQTIAIIEEFNYIQNSIADKIKNQKTKIGEKALREVIEDYNKWMLGEK